MRRAFLGPLRGRTEGDRHLLVVDRDRWLLYELFAARWTGQRWEAGSGAVFDLSAMDGRWNNDELNPAFRSLSAADFDVVRLGWR